MEEIAKNKKIPAKGDLPERIENSWLGRILIPLCDLSFIVIRRAMSFFRKRGRNIVIISLHRLGDTVFTIPAIKKILNHYKNYNSIIICFPESESILNYVFHNNIISVKKNNFKFGDRIAASNLRTILRKKRREK